MVNIPIVLIPDVKYIRQETIKHNKSQNNIIPSIIKKIVNKYGANIKNIFKIAAALLPIYVFLVFSCIPNYLPIITTNLNK